MDGFTYRNGQLFCENVNLDELADHAGSPVYVYSKATFLDRYRQIASAFAPLDPVICYSIKSCGNVHLLKLLVEQGSGMDVVSGGELHRALQAGADPKKIVYAGVGKTDAEIRQALAAGIGHFNIESEAEFENIAAIAAGLGVTAHGALRVNPDVDPKTHAKTTTGKKESKFGVDIERARQFFQTFGRNQHLKLSAIHLHIGSPVYTTDPYVQAVTKALALIDELKAQGFAIDTLDIGGGFGTDYTTGQSPVAADYAQAIVPLLLPFKAAGGHVILEPGRSIAGNAGILLTRVQYIKQGGNKQFVIIDSGMHHLVRPTLYDSFHFIWPTRVSQEHVPASRQDDMPLPGLVTCDVVGPICESGDFLAKGRALPPVQRGDLLAVFTAGAYGMVMASNYNAVPRPPEVLVDDTRATLIRRRETYDDLLSAEAATTPLL